MHKAVTALGWNAGRRASFTLLELLVVLGIIGALAAISLPAIRGMMKSNTMAAADRQLLDDFALARQQAISHRTTVHIIFVPRITAQWVFNPADPRDQQLGNRLKTGTYTTYALFAERSVGDQPGQPRFRYLTQWKTLPEGVFIAVPEFREMRAELWFSWADPVTRPFKYTNLPFPSNNGLNQSVPHIAFDSQGSLVAFDLLGNRIIQDEFIALARGSIFTERLPTGEVRVDAKERPPGNSITNYNRIRIDGLTGRARVERLEIQ